MGISLKKDHLALYKNIAFLLMKYGRSDLVKQMGLDSSLTGAKEHEAAADGKAEELPKDLEKLGPTFIKLGQFLSTRADILPEQYLKALTRLQDKVEPFAFEKVEEIVSNELQVRLSKAFSHFEEKPLAAASLSQVHLAHLREGNPVAVKVQRPDIRSRILKDLDALEDVAEWLENHTDFGKHFLPMRTLDEFRRALIRELNFETEARNLKTMHHNLSEFSKIVIPLPVEDYTTPSVLTMEYIQGKKITSVSPIRQLELGGAELAEQLFQAYLKQILIDGFFHADPHPGNVFITEDNRLALLDLGMTGQLSDQMQRKLLQLLVNISESKGEEAAKIVMDISEKTQLFNEPQFKRDVSELITTYNNLTIQELEVGRVVLEVTRLSAANGIRFPSELTMLGKALLNLDKVGRTLDPEFDPNSAIRRHAVELYERKMRQEATPKSFLNMLIDTKELISDLPGRLNKILEKIGENQLKIDVNAFDERYLMVGMQKIANRLTLGMILAAMIVGAALMMNVDTSFKIIGYPGFAMIFFLLAGLGGILLSIKILFQDESHIRKG
ncbi:MAG: AarF/UbiB family protein [Calditrichia bacterium]